MEFNHLKERFNLRHWMSRIIVKVEKAGACEINQDNYIFID